MTSEYLEKQRQKIKTCFSKSSLYNWKSCDRVNVRVSKYIAMIIAGCSGNDRECGNVSRLKFLSRFSERVQMSKSKSRTAPRIGRPPVFTGNTVKHIVSLVKRHGGSGAVVALRAEGAAEGGDAKLTKISLPTVLKFAKAAGVELKRGRRAA